jgi:hypothetical protein
MRPEDPRLQFRTAFIDLLRVIVPFLSNYTPSSGDQESIKLLCELATMAEATCHSKIK